MRLPDDNNDSGSHSTKHLFDVHFPDCAILSRTGGRAVDEVKFSDLNFRLATSQEGWRKSRLYGEQAKTTESITLLG